MKANIAPSLDEAHTVHLVGWADLPILDGDPVIDRYVEDNTDHPADERADGWLATAGDLFTSSRANAPADEPQADLLLTVEGPLFNSSAVALAGEQREITGSDIGVIDPADVAALADDQAALTAYLTAACEERFDHLVTGPAILSWPEQALPPATVEAAARDAGFHQVDTLTTPDGRGLTLWSR